MEDTPHSLTIHTPWIVKASPMVTWAPLIFSLETLSSPHLGTCASAGLLGASASGSPAARTWHWHCLLRQAGGRTSWRALGLRVHEPCWRVKKHCLCGAFTAPSGPSLARSLTWHLQCPWTESDGHCSSEIAMEPKALLGYLYRE